MARLRDVLTISASKLENNDDKKWLLNLDAVEQQTGSILSMNYVSKDELNGSVIAFDSENVLYSKLRPNLNKVVLPCRSGYATSEMLPLRPNTTVLTREYLAAYLRSDNFVNWAITKAIGAKMPRLSSNEILNKEILLPPISEQRRITSILDKLNNLISLRKQQLSKLDELVKARFVEMFGDPIKNTLGFPTKALGEICLLKAGITTPSDAIFGYDAEHKIPCYVGNGIRGYVKESTQHGTYPIIGRQGALCGNVQFAQGDFHATEHAVLVTPRQQINIYWLFYLLKYMDLYRYHTGTAQPGLAVKTLNTVDIPIVDLTLQDDFATLIEKINRHKLTIQQSLDKLEVLKKSLMQEYFGPSQSAFG